MNSELDLGEVSSAQLALQLVEPHSLPQAHLLIHLLVVLEVISDTFVQRLSPCCRSRLFWALRRSSCCWSPLCFGIIFST